jgi:hypothetical protein
MRRAMIFLILILAAGGCIAARAQAPAHLASTPVADRLGLSCGQILKMTSTEWIDDYGKKTGSIAANMPYDLLHANAAYGKCYDARTDVLALSLARTGKGPTKSARAEFAAFEVDLKDFQVKALASAKPADANQLESRADLYEKQFRYEFYEEYEAKSAKPATAPTKATATAAKSASPPGGHPAAANSASREPASAEEQARSDADPVTQAKNRFGKILEALPDDQMHEIHRALSEVIGPHAISEPMRLALYRYAIYILQPPGATPVEPPPF